MVREHTPVPRPEGRPRIDPAEVSDSGPGRLWTRSYWAMLCAHVSSADPLILATQLRHLAQERVEAIREWAAGDESPGGRRAYWAASTVLGAWPAGRAYPVAWVDSAGR